MSQKLSPNKSNLTMNKTGKLSTGGGSLAMFTKTSQGNDSF